MLLTEADTTAHDVHLTMLWTAWTGLGTALLALFALVGGLLAYRQLREATQTRLDAVAPYVVVFMEQSQTGRYVMDLVCRNYGRTAASNVVVKFDPPPLRWSSQQNKTVRLAWPTSIPTLAPDQEYRIFWDLGYNHTTKPMPQSHKVEVTYDSLHGEQLKSSAFLDWDILRGPTVLEVKNLHHVAEGIDAISKTLEALREGQGSQPGLSVYVRDGEQHDADLQAAEDEQIRRFKADQPRSERWFRFLTRFFRSTS